MRIDKQFIDLKTQPKEWGETMISASDLKVGTVLRRAYSSAPFHCDQQMIAHARIEDPPAQDPPADEPPIDDPATKQPPVEEPGRPAPAKSA